MVCSGAICNYVTMADSRVINSGHEPNSVQSLLQCPFERRTLAEKLKVKELGPDQPDGLMIYCEELFVVPVCHSPTSKQFHQPPLVLALQMHTANAHKFEVLIQISRDSLAPCIWRAEFLCSCNVMNCADSDHFCRWFSGLRFVYQTNVTMIYNNNKSCYKVKS